MWITRNKDGQLILWFNKPIKLKTGIWRADDVIDDAYCLDSDLFPEVKWEDEGPREVIFKLI